MPTAETYDGEVGWQKKERGYVCKFLVTPVFAGDQELGWKVESSNLAVPETQHADRDMAVKLMKRQVANEIRKYRNADPPEKIPWTHITGVREPQSKVLVALIRLIEDHPPAVKVAEETQAAA